MTALGELVADHLDRQRSLLRARRTLEGLRYELAMLVQWLEGRGVVEPGRLGRDLARRYQRHLVEFRTPKGTNYAPGTVNHKLKVARGFLRHLADLGLVHPSLAEELRDVKIPKSLPLNTPSHEEIRRTLEAIDLGDPLAFRDRTLLETLYSTGVRASELANLDVESVDRGNGTILVERGKGGKDRVVPVGRTALGMIETYVKAVRPFHLANPAERALFLSFRGKRIDRGLVNRIVHRHFDGEDRKGGVTAHAFRRACATELVRGSRGRHLYEIKEILGHESLDTMKRYVSLTAIELKRMHSRCHPREKDARRRSGSA